MVTALLSIATNDEARKAQLPLIAEAENARDHYVEIAGIISPAVDALRAQVGPLVIKIERQARQRFRHAGAVLLVEVAE